jgi:hypothetical protein
VAGVVSAVRSRTREGAEWQSPLLVAGRLPVRVAAPGLRGDHRLSQRQDVIYRCPSIDVAGPDWPPRPLPAQYVVVGRHGYGPVVVDTSSEDAVLRSFDNEGYWLAPLIDFAAQGKTPAEVARSITGNPAAE